ncbi:hypothetical protein K435DRAFT_869905 [Dendrothele bispora CBS 962.96]|uniref:Uncharacterized protein n=1 Tax=Dendrothele bispora (strain CBS 962.96) TaxID=1314807 RepID=A0A4S8L8M3_DENBC|nr:hypothetical protein K435DRAFT_869905 [Dendrothele bispora CBS 962.96]
MRWAPVWRRLVKHAGVQRYQNPQHDRRPSPNRPNLPRGQRPVLWGCPQRPATSTISKSFAEGTLTLSASSTSSVNGERWEKNGYEGSMFLYERNSYPPYGFYILNRHGAIQHVQDLHWHQSETLQESDTPRALMPMPKHPLLQPAPKKKFDAAGGRYDGLVGALVAASSGDPKKASKAGLPCIGVSIGLDRIFERWTGWQKQGKRVNETMVYVMAAG